MELLKVYPVELIKIDINSANEFINEVLLTDTIVHFRNVSIMFEYVDGVNINLMERLRGDWLYKLITEQPLYLYFLNREQFRDVLKTISTYLDDSSPGAALQFKQYILESLSSMQEFYDTPTKLLFKIYNDLFDL